MRLSLRKPSQQLLRMSGQLYAGAGAFALFQDAARKLVSRTNEDEPEEFQRKIITGFIQDIQPDIEWRSETDINGALWLTNTAETNCSILLVVKRAYGAEMMTPLKPNVKALHTLILACFEYLETYGSLPAYPVVTDGFSWFWFDAADIRTCFMEHPRLRRIFQLRQQGKSETLIYAEIARTIREIQADIPVTYLNLRELVSTEENHSSEWIDAFLLFSKLYTVTNPVVGGDPALPEILDRLRQAMPDGFSTWFCRLLFLRALECKIEAVGGQSPTTIGEIQTSDDLAAILAVWKATHPALLSVGQSEWPEHIADTPSNETATEPADKPENPLIQLAHLLANCVIRLGTPPTVIPDDRFVLTAAEIDWLLSWLTGETGASLPVLRQTTRTALQEAISHKLNDRFRWQDVPFSQLKDKVRQVSMADALQAFRSTAVCDVYAGSGRLMQLALQELVCIQHTLGLLADGQGQSMHHYSLMVFNDQVLLTTQDGEPVYYRLPEQPDRNTEPQRIRKALFEAKKMLLTSALHGVAQDDTQRTIALTRLSLELLTDLYAVAEKKKAPVWPVFPGLVWQLQSGNGLLYQLDLRGPLLYGEAELAIRLDHLQQHMQVYRDKETPANARQVHQQLLAFRQQLEAQAAITDRPLMDRLTRLQAIYAQRYTGNLLFPEQLTPSQQADQEKLQQEIMRLSERIRQRQTDDPDAFEWRISWPDRLNEKGDFTGFDVIISQLPLIVPDIPESRLNGFKSRYKAVYAGKAPAFAYYLLLSPDLLADEYVAWLLLPDSWEKMTGTKKLQKWLEGKGVVRPETTAEADVDVIRIQKRLIAQEQEN